jgi:hypothetical protein
MYRPTNPPAKPTTPDFLKPQVVLTMGGEELWS